MNYLGWEPHVQFEGDQHQSNQHIEDLPHFVGEKRQTAVGVDLWERQVRYATVVRARYVILEAGGTRVLATSVRRQSRLTKKMVSIFFYFFYFNLSLYCSKQLTCSSIDIL